jgi:hypothetical protein
MATHLLECDTDALDVVAVPEGLEEPVGEPHDEHVLDHFLAEVVVNPVDLRPAIGRYFTAK